MSNCDEGMKELERLLEEAKASAKARAAIPPEEAPPEGEALPEAKTLPADEAPPAAEALPEEEALPEAEILPEEEIPMEAEILEEEDEALLEADILPEAEMPEAKASALAFRPPASLLVVDKASLEAGPASEETALPSEALLPPAQASRTVVLAQAFVSSWPTRQQVLPVEVALDSIEEDDTFRLRKKDDSISALAAELSRLGQLEPVELRPLAAGRFQLISGFRRIEALRFLHKDSVVARIHLDLSDTDAWLLALASSLHTRPVSPAALLELKKTLEETGQMQPVLRDMLECALAPCASPAKEASSEEVDADELAMDVAMRMAVINQDLSLVADVFLDLEPSQRVMLLKQLRYASDMVAFLERLE